MEQFLNYGMAGLIYDFKFPVLAGAAQKALLYAQPQHEKLLQRYQENKKANQRNDYGIYEGLSRPIRHRVINFVDMERTEKVNPLRPQEEQRATASVLRDMVQVNHERIAREVAQAIDQSGVNSLSKAALAAANKAQGDQQTAARIAAPVVAAAPANPKLGLD